MLAPLPPLDGEGAERSEAGGVHNMSNAIALPAAARRTGKNSPVGPDRPATRFGGKASVLPPCLRLCHVYNGPPSRLQARHAIRRSGRNSQC